MVFAHKLKNHATFIKHTQALDNSKIDKKILIYFALINILDNYILIIQNKIWISY